ncbi:MAG: PQQ-dependent sugar dehydrogenase [Patescibacteria group bacterium]
MTKSAKVSIFIIIIVLILAGILWWLNTNTSFLSLGNNEQEIINNNFNNQPVNTSNTNTAENTNTEPQAPAPDLTELIEQDLQIPAQYQTGTFATARKLNLPAGFTISLYAAGLTAPRFFDFDEENNLIVADKGAGKIFLLKDTNQDGTADENIVIDSDLKTMHSVDFYKGDLFAGEEHQIIVYRDLQPDGTYSAKDVLVADLPSDGGHSTRTVLVGPDEKLYVSVGSSCNICEEKDERRAAVMQYDLDGSNGRVFAKGLRNAVGIAFYKGDLWSVTNGRDRLGDDIPQEEVDILEKGNHYGWPYCYGKGVVDPSFPARAEFCANDTTDPVYLMQAHSAPLGVTFNAENSVFPVQLQENMFVGFHGSWNRSVPTGYKVVRINTGDAKAEPVNFITGWLDENGDVWGRPVGVGFDQNGVFYISDDEAGAIYRVTYTE